MPKGNDARALGKSKSSGAKSESKTSRKSKMEDKDAYRTKKGGNLSSSDSEQEYEVDFIEGHKVSKDGETIQFYVRWKNYAADQNTWETFEFFAHDAPEIAQKYFGKAFKMFKVPRKTENL